MTSDDWRWFWASESSRDNLLREGIGGLSARLSSANAQSSRLSSQLANLSGSIESRLNALSRAFDAYVELGDVREELTAYAEPAAVRRDVMVAVATIAGGRPAARIDARGLDYWLPYAMNAVTAMTEGHVTEDLDRARELSPEADLFVVAALGALGHGVAAAPLLAGVLTADESLTDHQLTVWRAVAAGRYGSELPEALTATWRPQLDREPASGWSAWVTAHGPTPASGLEWLRTVVEPGTPPAPARPSAPHDVPGPDADDASAAAETPDGRLRAVVTELIQRGMPAEEALLARARELRTLIERPNLARSTKDTEAAPPTVVSEVRRALLEPTTDASIRALLLSWSAPALVTVVDELAASTASAEPPRETLRGHGGLVVVTAAGTDATALEAAEERLRAAYRVQNTPLIVWSVGTGVAALLALVLAVVGSGWVWLVAVALVAGIIGTVRQVAARRQTQRSAAAALERLQREVAETSARLDELAKRQAAQQVQLDGEAAQLRDRLTAVLAGSPDRVGAPQP